MKKVAKNCLIVGGIGGALPLIINLINVDASTMFKNFEWLVFLGYFVRVTILILLGALLVWINSENDVKRAFQLGIMAPAVVVGYLNATDVQNKQVELDLTKEQLRRTRTTENTENNGQPSSANFFISSAHADSKSMPKGIHKKPSSFDKIWYGFTGSSANDWFVIAGSHRNEQAAKEQVQKIMRLGYDAEVFPRLGGNDYYGVMIGSYITLKEAKTLRKKAIKDGLPKDTYVWKLQR